MTHNAYCVNFCFNSRARKGRDVILTDLDAELRVSIHAPARGATRLGMMIIFALMFQFTRPQGARPPQAK